MIRDTKNRGRRSLAAQRKQRQRLRFVSLSFASLAAAVFLTGAGLSLYALHANSAANAQAALLVAQANHGINNGVPSTIKPTSSAFTDYTVGATLPRYLFIQKLNVQAIIRPLGLTSSGQLAAPSNVFDVGWYTASSKPGQSGAMVVDGHVSSWTTNGVFYGLHTLVAGDQIQVELGNSSQVTYTVVRKQIYPATQTNIPELFTPVNPKKPGLNLITCTGSVEPGTSEFNERVVVFTEEN